MDEPRRRSLVAVLFADIVGSTTLARSDEDAALAVRDELIRWSRTDVERHRGRWVKSVGDGVLAVFEATEDAVRAALALRGSFESSVVARAHGTLLRVSVHVGDVLEEPDGDIVGDAVNVVFRIDGAAAAGQVWISRAVCESVRARPSLCSQRSAGLFDLKGVGREELFVVWGPAGPEPPLGNPTGVGASVGIDPTRYLEELEDEHSRLELRGMAAQVAESLDLDTVYTELRLSMPSSEPAGPGGGRGRPGGKSDPSADEGRPELRDALAEHRHAALVGDPGSGKTTYLRYVALHLARAQLEAATTAVAPFPWPKGEAVPFPILVRLEHFARFLDDEPDRSLAPDAPEHFYRFLTHVLRGSPHLGLTKSYLRDRVMEGGCFLLLDGLDEVPGREGRLRMVGLIDRVIRAGRDKNRHLVTCRSRAYVGPVRLYSGVSTFRLAEFERPQVERFADNWSRALFRVRAGDEESAGASQASKYRGQLLQAIEGNPSSATFSANPLMLTVLAVVHWNKRKLPEQRSELYEAAVEYLLDSRRELSEYPPTERRESLQALALHMFTDPEGVQRSVDRDEAARIVRPVLATHRKGAEAFLEHESLHSGLLVSRREGELEFWHLTFQEYLASMELTQADDGWETLRAKLYEDRWSEVVLLHAGCVRRLKGARKARTLVQQILGTGEGSTAGLARAVGLAGRVLRDISPYYKGDPARGTGYREALGRTLAVFTEGGEPVAEEIRVEVGEALGVAGDPRLHDREHNRILVPGGTFLMGAQKKRRGGPGYDRSAYEDEGPTHQVTLVGFFMSRFPVTVQEFRDFVESDAYGDPRHWDEHGLVWLEESSADRPGSWERQLRYLNRPVVCVSWHEARAYCSWVGGRLPSEAEWEYAARGTEGRRYPWGNEEPDDRRANSGDRVGHPTPVGMYPAGRTPLGVEDLAGNVYEWCEDAWRNTYAEPDGAQAGDAPSRVVRGGAFNGHPSILRASFRYFGPPVYRGGSVGFRVVWESSGGQG